MGKASAYEVLNDIDWCGDEVVLDMALVREDLFCHCHQSTFGKCVGVDRLKK